MSSLYVDNIVPNLGSQVQIPNLKPLAGSVVQVQEVYTDDVYPSINSTAYAEVSSSLRVSIAPTATTSKIKVEYFIPVNFQTSVQVIWHNKIIRDPAGTPTDVTSIGSWASKGNRSVCHTPMRGPSYDLNDAAFIHIVAWDEPSTTSAVTYGWQAKRETGATMTLQVSRSAADSSVFGWVAPVYITATEYAQ